MSVRLWLVFSAAASFSSIAIFAVAGMLSTQRTCAESGRRLCSVSVSISATIAFTVVVSVVVVAYVFVAIVVSNHSAAPIDVILCNPATVAVSHCNAASFIMTSPFIYFLLCPQRRSGLCLWFLLCPDDLSSGE